MKREKEDCVRKSDGQNRIRSDSCCGVVSLKGNKSPIGGLLGDRTNTRGCSVKLRPSDDGILFPEVIEEN